MILSHVYVKYCIHIHLRLSSLFLFHSQWSSSSSQPISYFSVIVCVCGGILISFIRYAYRNVSERLSYIVGALLMVPALKSAFPLFLPFSATINCLLASGRGKALWAPSFFLRASFLNSRLLNTFTPKKDKMHACL